MDKAPNKKPPPAALKAKKTPAPPSRADDPTPSTSDTSEKIEDPRYFLGEDEEFFIEDKELEEVLKEEQPTTMPAATSQQLPQETIEPFPNTLSDIPLTIEVVVGYMRIPIKELLSMQVGGTYKLGNIVSSQVDLLINGKRIAKGELLKSGDMLGVRILSL